MYFQNQGYYICQLCGSRHDSPTDLNIHFKIEHPSSKFQIYLPHMKKSDSELFKCDACPQKFTFQSNLYRHQRVLHGIEAERKHKQNVGEYQCEICDRRLAARQNLRNHMMKAHGVTWG